MAGAESSKPCSSNAADKLPPIPKGAKVQKRLLIRRQMLSSSKGPIIYISCSTPFMSAVKRVQKYLDKSLRNSTPAAPKNASLHARVDSLSRSGAMDAASGTVVSGQGGAEDARGGGLV